MPMDDMFGDFIDEEILQDEASNPATYRAKTRKVKVGNEWRTSRRQEENELGPPIPPTPEILAEREEYRKDYVKAHPALFQNSTGLKPFGAIQIESIQRMQQVMQYGGQLLQIEPRGFGKTSRGANNILLGTLLGDVTYTLILANSIEKGVDIVEGMQTELMDNDELLRLFPNTIRAFREIQGQHMRARAQTSQGNLTHIGWNSTNIRFPVIEGEASSGSIIVVRAKDNVRGLNKKMRYGPHSGKVIRPNFILLDDIQTDEDSRSPTLTRNTVHTINRSLAFAGSQFSQLGMVMTATPITYGDTVTHFALEEPFWEVVQYSMVTKMPVNLEMWLTDYANILLNFNKRIRGDRQRAALRAKAFVEENYEKLHEGSEVAWEWGYQWNSRVQLEVSALHHAMNLLIQYGQEAFDLECQCKIEQKNPDGEPLKATIHEIVSKTTNIPRNVIPVDCKHIVTHIDVHDDALVYMVVASPDSFQPYVIDFGIYPEQPGIVFEMHKLMRTLKGMYPDIPENELRVQAAVKDLVNRLGAKEYQREDGILMQAHLIGVDVGYLPDNVRAACRDSLYKNIAVGSRGIAYQAKDKPFEERSHPQENTKHFHCYTTPSSDRVTFEVCADVNYFKTQVHAGVRTRRGQPGSINLFLPERETTHGLLASHWCNEEPRIDHYPKEDRTLVVWGDRGARDNEALDNMVGCMALLFKRGCTMKDTTKVGKAYNIQDFIDGTA